MKIEFDIKLKPKDLFAFNMYQSYTSVHGLFSIVIAIVVFIMAGYTFRTVSLGYTILYIAFGIVFLIYIPGTLWLRVNHTMKTNEILAGNLHFEVSWESIKVKAKEDEGVLHWDEIYKIIGRKNLVLIYSDRIHAYVVPREQLGDKYDAFKEIATQKLEKYRVKMK